MDNSVLCYTEKTSWTANFYLISPVVKTMIGKRLWGNSISRLQVVLEGIIDAFVINSAYHRVAF